MKVLSFREGLELQHTLEYKLAGLANLLKLCLVFDGNDILQLQLQQAVVYVLRRPFGQPRVFKVVLKLYHVLTQSSHDRSARAEGNCLTIPKPDRSPAVFE